MTDAEKPVGRDSDKFMLRIPAGMRGQVTAAAKDSGRSMNSEIVHRLEKSFSSITPSQEDDIMGLMYQLAASAAKKGLILDIRVSHKLLENRDDEDG